MLALLTALAVMLLNPLGLSAEEELVGSNVGANFAQLTAVSIQSQFTTPCLLAYNQPTGIIQISTINHAGGNNGIPITSNGFTPMADVFESENFTHLVSFYGMGAPYYLLYDASTGDAHIGQVSVNCDTSLLTLGTGKLPAHLTHLMPFSFEGSPYLMTYNSAFEGVQFYQLGSDGKSITKIGDDSSGVPLAAGFSSLMPFSVNGSPYFLAYNSTFGTVEFDSFAFVIGQGFVHGQTYTHTWLPGMTHFFTSPTNAQFICYSATTGGVDFDTISPSGPGFVPNQKLHWSPGVSQFAAFYFTGSSGGVPIAFPGFVPYFEQSVGSVKAGTAQVWLF